jgi:hypothetical protein
LPRTPLSSIISRPGAKRSYRVVVLRKLIEEERGHLSIATNFRYFFYVTNDRRLSQQEVVAESNDRCNQENIHAQLKSSRALRAPLNTLDSNWAYMLIASLAWTLTHSGPDWSYAPTETSNLERGPIVIQKLNMLPDYRWIHVRPADRPRARQPPGARLSLV